MDRARPKERDFNIISHTPLQYVSKVILPTTRTSILEPLPHELLKQASKKVRNQRNEPSAQLARERGEYRKEYGSIETKTYWDERKKADNEGTMFNCSSVKYNFINNIQLKKSESAAELREVPQSTNRKKAIAEFHDFSRPFHPNYHPDYKQLIQKNKNVFRLTKGRIANFLDQAHKTGMTTKPFPKYKCEY
jgi:hypothetical protein